jgi:hypothetical protein
VLRIRVSFNADLDLKKYRSKWQFTYPKASIKDFQATGEVFIPQKKTTSTSKLEFSSLVVHFGSTGSGSVFSMRIRIPIQPTKMNADPDPADSADPDPQHCSSQLG